LTSSSSSSHPPRVPGTAPDIWSASNLADFQTALSRLPGWDQSLLDEELLLDLPNSDDSLFDALTHIHGEPTAPLVPFPGAQAPALPGLSGITTRPPIPEAGNTDSYQTRQPALPAPSRSNTQLTTSTFDGSLPPTQLFDDAYDLNDHRGIHNESAHTSFSETMPTTRKRSADPDNSGVANGKRRRTSAARKSPLIRSQAAPERQPVVLPTANDEDDVFGEDPTQSTAVDELFSEDLPTIDLTETNEVPEELLTPEEDKRIKLSAFQCVICMDDVTNLTVTHCGHLYCAQCLHSSLHVEVTKGKCPMCRSKIDMKPRETYSTKTKGYWPLELRLMTVTRKGKQRAAPNT
jgi:DNA-directed RNA polymerase subunit RPC12/RpoP